MSLESIKIWKAEDLPPETRAKCDLPDKGLVEVRMEKTSPVSPKFTKFTKDGMAERRKKLRQKKMLF